MKKLFIVLCVAFATTTGAANAYIEYRQDETSSVGTIIKDSVIMFGMNLMTIEDRIYVLFGSDIALESLNTKLHDISYVSSRAADTETLTYKITTGILWLSLFLMIVYPIFAIIKAKIKKGKK